MPVIDASVDGVSAYAFSSAIIVCVRSAARATGGDASKAPRCVVLSNKCSGSRDAVLFNVLNLCKVSLASNILSTLTHIRMVAQSMECIFINAARKSMEDCIVGMFRLLVQESHSTSTGGSTGSLL